MARAYYPNDHGEYVPWTADMVEATPLLAFPSNSVCKMKLGVFQATNNTNGQSFTLNLHTNYGYNGSISQAQETTLRFAFGNGSGILHIGWCSTFPVSNLDSMIFYYLVQGTTVEVYIDNKSYPGDNTTYSVHCGTPAKWIHKGEVVSSIPSAATPFEKVTVSTNYDPEVVVSTSQPTNSNAKVWVKI